MVLEQLLESTRGLTFRYLNACTRHLPPINTIPAVTLGRRINISTSSIANNTATACVFFTFTTVCLSNFFKLPRINSIQPRVSSLLIDIQSQESGQVELLDCMDVVECFRGMGSSYLHLFCLPDRRHGWLYASFSILRALLYRRRNRSARHAAFDLARFSLLWSVANYCTN